MGRAERFVADSATRFQPQHQGAVVVCGSHGGVYTAYLAALAGLRAVIFSDAGVGKDRAGIAALAYGEALGMAVATVAHDTARIGDAADMLARGRISYANAVARSLDAMPGMRVAEAADRLTSASPWHGTPPAYQEARTVLEPRGLPPVVCIDSASLVRAEDAGRIVLTGSHGGLLGGDPAAALKVDALAAVFNDAGIGIDQAGTTRLPALDRRGIAAATVAAASARIGDGRSTHGDGVLSRVNATAAARGARGGLTTRAFVDLFGR